MTSTNETSIRIIQSGSSQADLVRPATPEATPEQVTAATCSCVVHLCGCKS